MKAIRILIISAAILFGASTAQAQFGNLIGGIKKAKEKVDEYNKKRNGDIDFSANGTVQGFFRSRTGEFIFNEKHADGERKGKKVVYKVEENGDVVYDDGRKVAELKADGTVNCRGKEGYMKVLADGQVIIDGETAARITDDGRVYIYDVEYAYAPGLNKQYAAYLFLGIFQDETSLAKAKTKAAEIKKKRAEEAKRQQEEAARQRALAAQNKNVRTATTSKSSNNTQQNVREYRIEKGSARGYVDENGVVYNWAHTKLGQLPKGSSGDITDASGHRIGSVWSGDIKDAYGSLLCHVSSGGSISVKGSNATVAEVHAAGRVDWWKDSKTIGYCDCNNYVWTAAIIFCDIFRF
jgi:pyruvate/2-oxoglutarate dehydrogenase complex dihydrolipoamide acyltransferase (E2) component